MQYDDRPTDIDFEDILSYAAGFPEVGMIGSRPVDMSVLTRSTGSVDGPVTEFAGITAGTPFGEGWKVTGIAMRQGEIDVACEGADGSATFILASPGGDTSWPFDIPAARVGYHRTTLKPAALSIVGRQFAAFAGRMLDRIPGSHEARWSALIEQSSRAVLDDRGEPDPAIVERRPDGKVYVRVTDKCQERCVFCFFYDSESETDLAARDALDERIGNALELIDPDETTQIILTGGEPTLAPGFERHVQRLLDRGFSKIVVQTNGILPGRRGILDRFAAYADRLSFGFSLHAATSATSTIVTQAGSEDTFIAKTESITRAVELGYVTKITCVLTTANIPEIMDVIAICLKLRQVDPDLGHVILQFSMPAIRGLMNANRNLYPTLSQIRQAVEPALDLATAEGLRASFSSLCSIPPCCLPRHLRHLETMWYREGPTDWWESEHAFGPDCHCCALKRWCSGVSPSYLYWFGHSELVPFSPESTRLLLPDC